MAEKRKEELIRSVEESSLGGMLHLEGRYAEVCNADKVNAQLQAAKRAHPLHTFHTAEFQDIEFFPLPTCQYIAMRKDEAELRPCTICSAQRRLLHDQERANCLIYADAVNNDEAQKILDGFTTSITADLALLHEHLLAHADVLMTRWKNKGKTATKRTELLLSAMPNMPKPKHSVLHLQHEERNWYEHPEDRKAWLLPWLSFEDILEKPQRMMHLLHIRTIYKPQDWVLFDNKHLNIGWNLGTLRTQYDACSVIVCGAEYGLLHKLNVEANHRWYMIAYPRARLVLEAQALLYVFLRRFVERLLDGACIVTGSEK